MAKKVALAVVVNPQGVLVIDGSKSSGATCSGVSESMVRGFIEKDVARYPELREKAAGIEEIVITGDENISMANYAQDMTKCYVKRMQAGGWAVPGGLHIFETIMASVKVFVAYGT